MPWQDAAATASGMAVATRILKRPVQVAAWTRELSVVFGLYALWQLAGNLSLGRAAGAVARGAWIARAEARLHVPSEASLQRLFLGDHAVLRAFNLYYVGLHVAVTGACLVWMFARHRDLYPAVRNTMALVTGACLLVALLPVAPPRLVPGLGVVDTGRLVGPTVYPATDRPGLDQLSAMPSVHVAWALVVGWSVVHALKSPWRWLAVAYPAATVLVVVATGNHYWADAVAALAIFTAGRLVTQRMSLFPERWRARASPARALSAAEAGGASLAGGSAWRPPPGPTAPPRRGAPAASAPLRAGGTAPSPGPAPPTDAVPGSEA